MILNRSEALSLIKELPPNVLEAIAYTIQTADVQGEYQYDGDGSTYEDDVQKTLYHLAEEIREFKNSPKVPLPSSVLHYALLNQKQDICAIFNGIHLEPEKVVINSFDNSVVIVLKEKSCS